MGIAMRTFSLLMVTLAISGLCLFAARADDDAKKKADDKETKAKPKQLVSVGQLAGKIIDINDDGTKFAIEIEGEMPYWYKSSTIGSRTPPKIKSKKEKVTVDVRLAEDAKVRLPIDRDEEDAKKANKDKDKEKDTKPKDKDANLSGKAGAPADLKKYQIVTVTFGQTKEAQPRIYGTLVLVVKERLGR